MDGKKLIAYRFTYNNYSNEGEEVLKTWLTDNCKYAVYGHEVAPTTGTPHLQGYLNLKKAKTMKTIQNQLGDLGVNLALLRADASADANRLYATKDNTGIFEIGDLKKVGQGARNDLKRVGESLDTGASLKKVARENPVEFMKYHTGIEKYSFLCEEDTLPAIRDVTVTLFWGDAGSGKTRSVYDWVEAKHLSYFKLPRPNNGAVWFTGYCRHDVLIIDDFKSWLRYHDLLEWLDCYKTQLPTKGGFVWAYYKYVFITSNQSWDKWYNPDNIDGYTEMALDRRIHNIKCFIGTWKEGNVTVLEERINKVLPLCVVLISWGSGGTAGPPAVGDVGGAVG